MRLAARATSVSGDVVVLADPEGAVPVVLEDLRRRSRLGGQCGRSQPGKPLAPSVIAAMPFRWWLRPVRKRGPRRRAERGRVPLRVGQPVRRRACRSVGMLIRPPYGRPGGQTRCRRRGRRGRSARPRAPLRREGRPVGDRIADVELDGPLEAVGGRSRLFLTARRRLRARCCRSGKCPVAARHQEQRADHQDEVGSPSRHGFAPRRRGGVSACARAVAGVIARERVLEQARPAGIQLWS